MLRLIRSANTAGYRVELWLSPDRLRGAIVIDDCLCSRSDEIDLTINAGRATASGPVPAAGLILMQDSGIELET